MPFAVNAILNLSNDYIQNTPRCTTTTADIQQNGREGIDYSGTRVRAKLRETAGKIYSHGTLDR